MTSAETVEIPGPRLRAARLAAGIQAAAVARVMAIRRQGVHELEARAVVAPDVAERYVAALESLTA